MTLGYDEAVAALASALKFGTNPSLSGIAALAEALGEPQRAYAAVQIAGTNGKTSTSRITAALIEAHGTRSGLYTSPELERYPERIEVGGAPVTDAQFAAGIEAAIEAARRALPSDASPTEFELLTAAALWLFRETGVDVAVLEVGLGGRWDATSVVPPAVAVVTGIGLDHTAILGSTREAIAAEKAAIIKPASAPVLGPGTEGVEGIFLRRAELAGAHARLVRAFGDPSPVDEALTVRYRVTHAPRKLGECLRLDVRGIHGAYDGLAFMGPTYQAANIATAVAAAEAALGRELDRDAVDRALEALTIPGRFEIVADDPPVVIDAAHNPQAARVLAEAVREQFGAEKPVVVLGVLADKDAAGIVRAMAPVAASFVVTASVSPRALAPDRLAAVVGEQTGVRPQAHASIPAALDAVLALGEPVLVTGSITVAGQARGELRRRFGNI